MHCPFCGASFEIDAAGSGCCAVTGLALSGDLLLRLRAAFPEREEARHIFDNDYYSARWYCPSCCSAIADDRSECPLCRRGLAEFVDQLITENPTRCSRNSS